MYLQSFYCPTCQRTVQVSNHHRGSECGLCQAERAVAAKRQAMLELSILDNAHRLERLESQMYDLLIQIKSLRVDALYNIPLG